MNTADQTFFWGIEPKFAVVQRNNGRLWMTDHHSAYLSSMPKVFQSKLPMMLFDISGISNNKQNLVDNSCCHNWVIRFKEQSTPLPMKKLSHRWIDHGKIFVGSDQALLIEQTHDPDEIELDLRQQIFLYHSLVRDVTNHYDTMDFDHAGFSENLVEIFASNLYISDIYKALSISKKNNIFNYMVLKYVPRRFKYD